MIWNSVQAKVGFALGSELDLGPGLGTQNPLGNKSEVRLIPLWGRRWGPGSSVTRKEISNG
eukprot:44079-Amorphochlora_amoeboformis.AAC.1